MKYVSNPQTVDAFKITNVAPQEHDGGGHIKVWLTANENESAFLKMEPSLVTHYYPKVGDYLVITNPSPDVTHRQIMQAAVFESTFAPCHVTIVESTVEKVGRPEGILARMFRRGKHHG